MDNSYELIEYLIQWWEHQDLKKNSPKFFGNGKVFLGAGGCGRGNSCEKTQKFHWDKWQLRILFLDILEKVIIIKYIESLYIL